MRHSANQISKTVVVAPGANIEAELSLNGSLRLERRGGSMAGNPAYSIEDGALALHFADGASVYIRP